MKITLLLIYAAAFLFISSFNSKEDIIRNRQLFKNNPEKKDTVETDPVKLDDSLFNLDILEINKKYMNHSGIFYHAQDTIKDPC